MVVAVVVVVVVEVIVVVVVVVASVARLEEAEDGEDDADEEVEGSSEGGARDVGDEVGVVVVVVVVVVDEEEFSSMSENRSFLMYLRVTILVARLPLVLLLLTDGTEVDVSLFAAVGVYVDLTSPASLYVGATVAANEGDAELPAVISSR